jgi:hypothetical protein
MIPLFGGFSRSSIQIQSIGCEKCQASAIVEEIHEITQVLQTLDAISVSLKLYLA